MHILNNFNMVYSFLKILCLNHTIIIHMCRPTFSSNESQARPMTKSQDQIRQQMSGSTNDQTIGTNFFQQEWLTQWPMLLGFLFLEFRSARTLLTQRANHQDYIHSVRVACPTVNALGFSNLRISSNEHMSRSVSLHNFVYSTDL